MNGGAISARSSATPAVALASATRSSTVAAAGEAPKHSVNASPWRHSTPFGIPVVPPV